MNCPRCRQENPTQAKFCIDCGASLARLRRLRQYGIAGRCPLLPSAGRRQAGSATGVRSPAPHVYTPKHLAEKILTSRTAIEGERKQVTVLFADLKGSMELLADRDPEEARKLLDPVLERMMEAVHRYEGTVNQVMGDGIMALFGALLAVEDHAVRACAALRMQESVKRYAEESRRAHGIAVRIRVGLNPARSSCGPLAAICIWSTALSGNDPSRGAHGAVGRSRKHLPEPGDIRADRGVHGGEIAGPMPVKGMTTPVEIYELTEPAQRARACRRPPRVACRFVGRGPELEHLIRAQEQARNGRGQVVAVVGEAGMGKLAPLPRVHHWPRVRAGWSSKPPPSRTARRSATFRSSIFSFVPQARGARRPPRAAGEGHRQAFTLDEALRPYLSAFLGLLEVPVEDAQGQALDPRNGGTGRSRPTSVCCAKRRRSRSSWCSRTCTGSIPKRRRCSTAW